MYNKQIAKTLLDAINEYDSGHRYGQDDPFNRAEIFHEYFGDWDVSEFLAEWYPETVCLALENMYYDMGAAPFYRLTDEGEIERNISELKDDFGENYEDYCTIICDAAFEGAIFIHE